MGRKLLKTACGEGFPESSILNARTLDLHNFRTNRVVDRTAGPEAAQNRLGRGLPRIVDSKYQNARFGHFSSQSCGGPHCWAGSCAKPQRGCCCSPQHPSSGDGALLEHNRSAAGAALRGTTAAGLVLLPVAPPRRVWRPPRAPPQCGWCWSPWHHRSGSGAAPRITTAAELVLSPKHNRSAAGAACRGITAAGRVLAPVAPPQRGWCPSP